MVHVAIKEFASVSALLKVTPERFDGNRPLNVNLATGFFLAESMISCPSSLIQFLVFVKFVKSLNAVIVLNQVISSS